jgi:hypothetical protein
MNRAGYKHGMVSLFMVTWLAACSTPPETIPEKTIQPEPPATELIIIGQMETIMQYYDSLRKHPVSELVPIYNKVKQNFAQNKSAVNRARLVLLLTLPNAPFRDLNSALRLLNDWPRDGGGEGAGLQSFRNLLITLLAEQQRLNQSADELAQKLKDEQKRAETLENQIEAIKRMEKNLILREP